MKYNFFVRFFLEVSLEIAICAFLNIQSGSWEHKGNPNTHYIGLILSYVFLGTFTAFILFTCWLLYWGSDN